jgi:S-adenosylmethionine:tRNA ribosyltransferase-isomerase
MSSAPSAFSSMPGEPAAAASPAGATPDLGATSAYAFDLPEALIATTPAAQRSESRLLVVPSSGPTKHLRFDRLPDLLRPDDVLVRNAVRVLPARLLGKKPSGGQVELLVLAPVGAGWDAPGPTRFQALARSSRPLAVGTRVAVGDTGVLVAARLADGMVEAVTEGPSSLRALLEAHGHVPLPPYIRRARVERGEQVPEGLDRARYQTVYAGAPGAVAAPTAGLHFTETVLAAIRARGIEVVDVELDVGAGTFRPIEAERLEGVALHAERYRIGPDAAGRINAARQAGRRLVAVGTTALRVVEDQAARGPVAVAGEHETRLFVRPGGTPVGWVGALITNFHLPRSSLLMLVCAFAGYERVRAAYAEAVAAGYRFYSYGDAMLLERGA